MEKKSASSEKSDSSSIQIDTRGMNKKETEKRSLQVGDSREVSETNDSLHQEGSGNVGEGKQGTELNIQPMMTNTGSVFPSNSAEVHKEVGENDFEEVLEKGVSNASHKNVEEQKMKSDGDDVLSLLDSIPPETSAEQKSEISSDALPNESTPSKKEKSHTRRKVKTPNTYGEGYSDPSLQSLLFDSDEEKASPSTKDRSGYLCSRCKQPKRGHTCPVPVSPSEKIEKRVERKRKKAESEAPDQTTKMVRLDHSPLPSGPPIPIPMGNISYAGPSTIGGTPWASAKMREDITLIFPKSSPGPYCRWMGFPIRYANGIVHYDTLQYEGNTYRVGDCAYFFSREGEPPYIGKIVGMWQREESEDTQEMFVNVLWFYRPHNIPVLTMVAHPKELFLGKVIDPNCVLSIRGKCNVLPIGDFPPESQSEDTYFCQYYYDEFKLYPLKHRGGHTTVADTNLVIDDSKLSSASGAAGTLEMEERENAKKRGRPPTRRTAVHNWPTDVHYLRTLKGYADLPLNVKIGLYTQADNYRGHYEILKISDESHPAYGRYGLFAKRDIPKHLIIGEYTGEVKLTDLSENPSRHTAVLYQGTKICVDVDATRQGNEFRYLNDYRGTGSPRPNVELHSAPINGEWHIFVLAVKPIPKGKELLVDYGSKWED